MGDDFVVRSSPPPLRLAEEWRGRVSGSAANADVSPTVEDAPPPTVGGGVLLAAVDGGRLAPPMTLILGGCGTAGPVGIGTIPRAETGLESRPRMPIVWQVFCASYNLDK